VQHETTTRGVELSISQGLQCSGTKGFRHAKADHALDDMSQTLAMLLPGLESDLDVGLEPLILGCKGTVAPL